MTLLPEGTGVFVRYQAELLASVSHHAVTVVEKSRRTGYSWAAAAIAVTYAMAADGQDVFYMGYNLEMAREFIDYCGEWAKHFQVAASEVHEHIFHDPDKPDSDIKAFRIEFDSGFKIVALPSVPRALRGMQGLVIIDEAAFHDNLDELLKAAFALLIWGGKVLVISTHDGDTNPFNLLVDKIRAGKLPYNLLRCTFDDALADGLFKRVCLRTGKEWTQEAQDAWRAEIIANYGEGAAEELFCEPSAGSGTFIPGTLIVARQTSDAPVLRYDQSDAFAEWPAVMRTAEVKDWCDEHLAPLLEKLNPDLAHVLGGDFARSGDLSVFWPLALTRDMRLHTPFTVELRNMPFQQQEQILFYICDRLPRFRAGALDARGNGQYLAEVAQQRYGSRVDGVMLSEGWYRDNMPRLRAAFEDASITIPQDRDTADDIRALKLVRGVARLPEARTTGKTGKRHGDAAIALALAVYASKADPEVYEYATVPAAAAGTGTMRMTANDDDDYDAPDQYGLRGSI